MNTNGSGQTRLTQTNYNEWSPSWSPDGARILYRAVRPGGVTEIRTIAAAGGEEVNLLKHEEEDGYLESPSWSPDGSRITFVRSTLTGSDIYVMDADGRNQTRLTSNEGSFYPSWLYVSPIEFVQLPDCTAGWTRLEAGGRASVSSDSDTPNRVRSEPSTSAEIIAEIHPGAMVVLLEGPVCADGLVFWKVQSSLVPGGMGWTAEGDGTDYWLVPEGP
jgi:dipeptidyl aminopeptidase/acylaminoacyl peptidase